MRIEKTNSAMLLRLGENRQVAQKFALRPHGASLTSKEETEGRRSKPAG